jgi:hypothetical protein
MMNPEGRPPVRRCVAREIVAVLVLVLDAAFPIPERERGRRTLSFRHSSFVIRHSSFVIRHSSFVIRHSSFVIRHSGELRFRIDADRAVGYDARHEDSPLFRGGLGSAWCRFGDGDG